MAKVDECEDLAACLRQAVVSTVISSHHGSSNCLYQVISRGIAEVAMVGTGATGLGMRDFS